MSKYIMNPADVGGQRTMWSEGGGVCKGGGNFVNGDEWTDGSVGGDRRTIISYVH